MIIVYILIGLVVLVLLCWLQQLKADNKYIDYNSVPPDVKLTTDINDNYIMPDGRQITWLPSEQQKAIDKLNKQL